MAGRGSRAPGRSAAGAGRSRCPSCSARYPTGRSLADRLKPILDRHTALERDSRTALDQLGTLGGGNHFVEVCLDAKDAVWVMLHSGSRGLGNRIGTYFIEQAKEQIAKREIRLVDQNLA